MNRVSRVGQIGIYFKKKIRIFIYEKEWKFVAFSAIIAFLVAVAMKNQLFKTYDQTKMGLFGIMSACIWVGIFNSIQAICKEREIIKHEHMTGMHISSYVIANMLYQLVVSLAESIVMLVVFALVIDFSPNSVGGGVMFVSIYIEYLITIFLTVYASDMLGMAVSSCVKTTNSAMTVMPFVLIVQMLLSGILFGLTGALNAVSYLTIGRWSMQALGSIGGLNNYPLSVVNSYPELNQFVSKRFYPEYAATPSHVTSLWLVMLAFCIVCALISIIRLKFIDNE